MTRSCEQLIVNTLARNPDQRNDPYEHRIDLWNNEAGRRIGDDTSSPAELARDTYAALRNSTLVTGLNDLRLRQLHTDDPRLRLPQGHPDRELVDANDVDAFNQQWAESQRHHMTRELAELESGESRTYFDLVLEFIAMHPDITLVANSSALQQALHSPESPP